MFNKQKEKGKKEKSPFVQHYKIPLLEDTPRTHREREVKRKSKDKERKARRHEFVRRGKSFSFDQNEGIK